ncbi:MAG: alpha/beta hydrolase [Micrococcales bacterium]
MTYDVNYALKNGLQNHQDADPIIVLLHGYGANEADLPDIIDHIGLQLPWVSIRGGLSVGPGAFAWFPLSTPGLPNVDDVVAGTEAIWTWIDANLPADAPLIVIGFSQGGLMASQLLRTRPQRIKDTVILAGFSLQGEQPGDAILKANKPRVLYCRGVEDRVIQPVAIDRTYEWLKDHAKASVPVYDGLGHSIDLRVLRDVAAHLASK